MIEQRSESGQMQHPTTKRISDIAIIGHDEVGEGKEGRVKRISLGLEGRKDITNKYLLKTFHDTGSPKENVRKVEVALKQWEDLRAINHKRKIEGKTTFLLPPVVRGYFGQNESGIIITDLSPGADRTFDAKELFLIPELVSPKEWLEIRGQIEKDIAIAQEEGVVLASGPDGVDPWFVVLSDGGREIRAYITDIGRYTATSASPELVARSTRKLESAIGFLSQKIEQEF